MTKSIGDQIFLIISIIGSLASIIAFSIFFAPHLNDQGMWGVIFLGVLTLFFLAYNLYLVFKYRKKIKYSEIYANLNIGFSYLHRNNRHEGQQSEIIQNLSYLCDELSHAFNVIYGDEIGVCIKFLIKDNQNKRVSVQTLVRDKHSKSIQRKTGTSDSTKHWLEGNSDFEFIYSNFNNDNIDTSFFHEDHLPICRDYKNTRLQNNWLPKNSFLWTNKFIRRRLWPLKYRSTLVVPIVPLLADDQSQDKIRGFLCLDSPKEGRFNKTVDVDILRGVSDGIFNQIDKLYQLVTTKKK